MGAPELWIDTYLDPRAAAADAAELEASGFDGVSVVDKQAIAPDPFVVPTAAATGTARLGLATGTSNPLTRHPRRLSANFELGLPPSPLSERRAAAGRQTQNHGDDECVAAQLWLRRRAPFPHVVAQNLFTATYYRALDEAVQAVVDRGLAPERDPGRLSPTMPNATAFEWNVPPDADGALGRLLSRTWLQLLAGVLGIQATLDVSAAIHLHQPGAGGGQVHNDLNVGWFSHQPRPDGVNPMDIRRCSYTDGRSLPGVRTVQRVRAATAIIYVGNGPWSDDAGGETGLYASQDDVSSRPVGRVLPLDNSLLLFGTGPSSWHAALPTRRRRTSIVMWLHQTRAEAERRWGREAIRAW